MRPERVVGQAAIVRGRRLSIHMDEQPIQEIRPVVVPAQFFCLGIGIATSFAVGPAFITFMISNVIIGGDPGGGSDGPVFIYGVIVYILVLLVALFAAYLKMFKEPERTTYSIFKDRIEYNEGFLTRNRRTLVFDQVIDVLLVEGVLQQTKAVGTVTLVTQQLVSTGESKLSNRRISLRNVPDPTAVYELLRSLALKKK